MEIVGNVEKKTRGGQTFEKITDHMKDALRLILNENPVFSLDRINAGLQFRLLNALRMRISRTVKI